MIERWVTLGQAPAGQWGWQDTELTLESSGCEKKKHSAENSGVLGLEWVDRSTEAGRVWVPGTLYGHRASNQIPRGFHAKKKKSFFGVKLLQCDYSHSLSWLTHDTNLPQNHSLWPHSLNDQKAVSISIKNYGAGRQSSTYWMRKRTWARISRTHWEPDSAAHICNHSFPTVRCEAEPGESLRWARLAYAVARRGLRQDERQAPTLEAVPWRYSRYMFSHHRTAI